ncbi:UNVERIFIED_CONTAM: hypothetical protein HHA_452280 [Hammondia hammondi]|eukprot:XP_008885386.1 hypothetical protein HHA_452280 [Hammondia hammondi]
MASLVQCFLCKAPSFGCAVFASPESSNSPIFIEAAKFCDTVTLGDSCLFLLLSSVLDTRENPPSRYPVTAPSHRHDMRSDLFCRACPAASLSPQPARDCDAKLSVSTRSSSPRNFISSTARSSPHSVEGPCGGPHGDARTARAKPLCAEVLVAFAAMMRQNLRR